MIQEQCQRRPKDPELFYQKILWCAGMQISQTPTICCRYSLTRCICKWYASDSYLIPYRTTNANSFATKDCSLQNIKLWECSKVSSFCFNCGTTLLAFSPFHNDIASAKICMMCVRSVLFCVVGSMCIRIKQLMILRRTVGDAFLFIMGYHSQSNRSFRTVKMHHVTQNILIKISIIRNF